MKTANIRNFAEEFSIPNITAASPSQTSNYNFRCDIFDRNFNVIYCKIHEKIICWEIRLNIQGTQLLSLIDKLEKDPENKSLLIKFKKMQKSFFDSCISFSNFVSQTKISETLVPSLPLSDGSFLYGSTSKITERRIKKRKNKTRKNFIKNERRKKIKEREFYMEKNNMNYNINNSEDQCLRQHQEYLEAREDVIKAEKALNSSVIFEAAWAIHDGTEEENIGILYEASALYEDYIRAVSRYNELIGDYK